MSGSLMEYVGIGATTASCFFLVYFVATGIYWELRQAMVAATSRTAQGVCEGAVAAGMHVWSGVGNMILSGENGVLSYAPKNLAAKDLEGPALIVKGILGNDLPVGLVALIWCKGPPVNYKYMGLHFERYSVRFQVPLLPLGYKVGLWMGRSLGKHVLQSSKPHSSAKWVKA